jgi:hypothetical protein
MSPAFYTRTDRGGLDKGGIDNKKKGDRNVKVRLDRGLGTDDWLVQWMNATVKYLIFHKCPTNALFFICERKKLLNIMDDMVVDMK